MNWLNRSRRIYAQHSFYDYLRKNPLKEQDLDLLGDQLPEGFYFQLENGGWAVYGPGEVLISSKEPTKENARRVALSRIKYMLRGINQTSLV
jgi:hypothetical protein